MIVDNIENKTAYGVVSKGNGECFTITEKHMSLTTGGGQAGQGYPCVLETFTIGNGQVDGLRLSDKAGTLNCMHDQQALLIRNDPLLAFHIMQDPINSDGVTPCISAGSPTGQATIGVLVKNDDPLLCVATTQPNAEIAENLCPTITAAAGMSGNNKPYLCTEYTVRRLTPLECERLQGFPDYWTDIGAWVDESGKPHKDSNDSARYKAIGNSIALPPWEYVLQRLSLCCGGDITMASLFDGMGGFPLIWERLNGAGTCLWASEIEEFPIAITKRHFSEVQDE